MPFMATLHVLNDMRVDGLLKSGVLTSKVIGIEDVAGLAALLPLDGSGGQCLRDTCVV